MFSVIARGEARELAAEVGKWRSFARGYVNNFGDEHPVCPRRPFLHDIAI